MLPIRNVVGTGKPYSKKIIFIWVSMYLAWKYQLDTIFTSPTGDRPAILHGHPSYVRSSLLQGKGSTLFLSYFKTQSIGPASGIKPATSRCAVKHFILTAWSAKTAYDLVKIKNWSDK